MNTDHSFLMITGPCIAANHSTPLSAKKSKYLS